LLREKPGLFLDDPGFPHPSQFVKRPQKRPKRSEAKSTYNKKQTLQHGKYWNASL